MNLGLPAKLKALFPNIIPADRPERVVDINSIKIDPQ